jgi:hypothetical protein
MAPLLHKFPLQTPPYAGVPFTDLPIWTREQILKSSPTIPTAQNPIVKATQTVMKRGSGLIFDNFNQFVSIRRMNLNPFRRILEFQYFSNTTTTIPGFTASTSIPRATIEILTENAITKSQQCVSHSLSFSGLFDLISTAKATYLSSLKNLFGFFNLTIAIIILFITWKELIFRRKYHQEARRFGLL